jgi:hypothetical protein
MYSFMQAKKDKALSFSISERTNLGTQAKVFGNDG